jgi:hypothetical protein
MGVEQITVVDTLWYYWVFFLLAAIIGSIASSVTNNNGNAIICGWESGNPKEEEGNPRKYNLGIIADIIIGIAAALGVLWTLTPQTLFQLIGIGTVAGYGGSSVLRALVNKLDAQSSQEQAKKKDVEVQLYQKEADESRNEANKNKDRSETNKILIEYSYSEQDKVDKNITDIKSFLSEYHKDVLKELYKNNLID